MNALQRKCSSTKSVLFESKQAGFFFYNQDGKRKRNLHIYVIEIYCISFIHRLQIVVQEPHLKSLDCLSIAR